MNWQLEFQRLTVLDDQEDGDQPYFVFFGFRSTPGVAGSTSVFWSGFLDDDWADGIEAGGTADLPYAMGGLSFPDVGTGLLGWVGIGFESDATPFGRIRDLMDDDVRPALVDALVKLVEQGSTVDVPALLEAVRTGLRQDVLETVTGWLGSFGDPDDLIGVQAGVWTAEQLTPGRLVVDFEGDDAHYRVTGELLGEAGPGHTPPLTVEQADADLPRRRADLLRTWGLKFRRGHGGELPEWVTHTADGEDVAEEGGTEALRIIAAGLTAYALSDGRRGPIGPRDWALWSGLPPEKPWAEHAAAFASTVDRWADGVRPYKQLGTKGIPGKDTPGIKEKENGDYDFLLRDLLMLVFLMAGRPALLPTGTVRKLLLQGTGAVPYAGQDPDEWLATGPNGRPYFRLRWPEGDPRLFVAKGSICETENHVLGTWSWRYLVNEYLEWVAGLPAGHPRADPVLAGLVHADPGRYVNGPAVRDWVLQLLGRVPHSGTFETNARPYESITVQALLAFAQAAGQLFPDDKDKGRVRTAARIALDHLATEFAFGSLEGKRLAPIRRNIHHQDTVGFYASDYLANTFGVLTGAYVYSDSIGAQIAAQPEGTDFGALTPVDDPSWAGPYYWWRADQNAGHALWSLLSGYRVPPPVHHFMLQRHGGWFARMSSRYSRVSYPLSTDHFTWVVGPVGEPDDPEFPKPRYFQDPDVIGPGPYTPVPQNYFAAPTYLATAGGRRVNHYDVTASDVIPEIPVVDVLGPLRDWLDSALGASEQLHSYDTFARPTSIIGRGNVQLHREKDIDGLERLLPTMRGRDAFQDSQNVALFKSFAVGYTYTPDNEDRHERWPQRYPAEWDAFRAPEVRIGRAVLRVFDFRSAPGHLLAGHWWVIGRVSKSDGAGQFEHYGRGFWEVVPGHRFASAAGLVAHVRATNPASHFSDDTDEHYAWRLASSGELVRFHNKYGSSASDQAFVSITAADGSPVPLDAYGFDVRDEASLRGVPLLDAWQVDRDYGFTGLRYAHADGHGRVTVHNPYLGSALVLDSSDHRSPSRTVTTPGVTTTLPAVPGTSGQVPGVGALALGPSLYATHYSTPELWQPSTVPGELVALDPSTLDVRSRVTVGRGPHAVARHAGTGRLFVVNYDDSSVSVVDEASFTVVTTLSEPGWGLNGLAVHEATRRVYVPQFGQQRVLVYDAASLALTGALTGLPLSGDVAVADDHLYVLVTAGGGQELVEYAITPAGHTELRRVAVPKQVSRPSELAVDAERAYVLTTVPGGNQQQLVVLDRGPLTVRGTVPLPDGGGLGVAASASQRVVTVVTLTALLVIDAVGLAVLHSEPLPPGAPKRVVVTDERTGATWYAATAAGSVSARGLPML